MDDDGKKANYQLPLYMELQFQIKYIILIYIYIYIYTHIVNWVNLLDKIIVSPDLIKLTTEISS